MGISVRMDTDAVEGEWMQSAATTLEEGAVERYHQLQGLEHPEPSGDPKKPNPEYVEAAEKVAAMETVLAPFVDIAPDMFVGKPTVQAYFKQQDKCLFFETATTETGLPAEDIKWSLKFEGSAADAPPPQDVPGLIHRNVAKFNECLKQLHGGAQAAQSCLCTMLEEEEYTLVAEQRRAIRVDLVFALLYLVNQLCIPPRAAVKVAKVGIDVLDKSVLGAWLVMGEKRQNITQEEAFELFRANLTDLAAPIPPAQPVIDLNQAKQLTEHMVRTFFAHFTLYQAVYQCEPEEEQLTKQVRLETTVVPLATSKAKTIEQVQQEAEDLKKSQDVDAYRKQRDQEAQDMTAQLMADDPEAERIVQAIGRKQQEAMRERFDQHYSEIEAKIAELEEPK